MRTWIFPTKCFILIIIMGTLLLGCNMPEDATGIYVWLDVPPNGLTIPVNQEVNIEGHASSESGISKIEVLIEGAIIQVFDDPTINGDLAQFSTTWTPPGIGEFNIQSIAYSADGEASLPDNSVVHVGDEPLDPSPTPVITEVTPTEVITPTLTPTVTPVVLEPVVNFYAEPASISAGFCSTIYWHVENVESVILGGSTQAFDGFYEDCLCSTQSYPLTVNHLDGSQEIVYMTIEVTGICATPTPPPDNTAPPVPTQYSPTNGYNYPSVASFVTLDWESVSDPSGIGEYQIEIQKHPGDNNWTPVSFSPIVGIAGSETTISVDSAIYRWRVRAIDGVGNMGTWSGWFTFTVPLS
ncbi:MAG: hypothetical protein HOD40_12160 [Chloroflexi bacterium]|nr:hypothetical protein [Chloroflexota bacterium]